ncbi:MAG: VOC family protein [Proteobacteria bacterium]|nr:VOC family protein [Pseudomonadota bacterium]
MFDPDGNLHEFYADMMDDWREVFHGKVGEAITGGWDPQDGNYLTKGRYHEDYELRRVDDALIHPVRFTSAVLLTKNYEAMVDFYGSVAGLEVAHRTPDGTIVSFAGPKASHGVDISVVKQSGDADVHHYSYEVANEVELDRAEQALGGANVAIEKKLDHATKRSIFVRDPDNMLCEFFVPRAVDLTAADDAANDDRLYLL